MTVPKHSATGLVVFEIVFSIPFARFSLFVMSNWRLSLFVVCRRSLLQLPVNTRQSHILYQYPTDETKK